MAMTSSVLGSLSQSFRRVPPAAVPAFLDCLLSSTGLSPSTLFESLVEEFPTLLEVPANGEKQFDANYCNYIASLVAGLSHLLEKLGDADNALQLFMWRVFIPLMKVSSAYDSEMFNKIVESLFDVVIKTNAWDVLGIYLAPFLMRSVGVSIGMLQPEESDIFKWEDLSIPDGQYSINMDGSFPLPLACHLLTSALEAALQSFQPASMAEKFAADLLWDLCNMTLRLLLQSVEHRSCVLNFLLPVIFKSFASQCSLETLHNGKMHLLSRNSFLKKIWECCKMLLSGGSLERRDAYSVLSLYIISSVSCKEGNESCVLEGEATEFDLRSEKEFWEEIRNGLVDDESLVRKQSLHILKSILSISVHSEEMPKSDLVSRGMTKRETWAEKEAKSLGVGKLYGSMDSGLTDQQQWEAFLLLYEMLEEYGTHLVEAAWSNQIDLLLKSSFTNNGSLQLESEDSHRNQVETPAPDEATVVFDWLAVLWNRGFHHDNPLVRCMIMESFLKIEWKRYGRCMQSMLESFVLGPFIESLNDPIHHKEFGLKGIYSSRTIEGAARFVYVYTSCLNARRQMGFVINLASLAKKQSFSRSGFMALVECIASSARVIGGYRDQESEVSPRFQVETCDGHFVSKDDMAHLLDVLKFVAESSKQHFNPKYRTRVYQKVLEAAASVVNPCDVPLATVLQFISAIPRDFTDNAGSLRKLIQEWLGNNLCSNVGARIRESLDEYVNGFMSDSVNSYDDEDLETWEFQTKRWARVLFLIINDPKHLLHILLVIENHGVDICKPNSHLKWEPVKFLILIMSLLIELRHLQEGKAELRSEKADSVIAIAPVIHDKFVAVFLSIMKDLISFADSSCSIFWSHTAVEDEILPGSVRGKLGGPSQRRLSVPTTTAVLRAVTSVKATALISSYCARFKSGIELKLASAFFWKLFQRSISTQLCDSEAAAEICLATFEALAPVLNAMCSAEAFNLFENDNTLLLAMVDGESRLEISVPAFLQNINNLLRTGVLVRSRRAVLLNWKWICMESLLSIMHLLQARCIPENRGSFFSQNTVKSIFNDIVENLENAGESSVLPMLRSVRLVMELLDSGKAQLDSSSGLDIQMTWHLVRSCWILHISCNKRRVASIAALLSSVLHPSLFSNKDMHITNDGPGPLKWFVEKVVEEGQKSPRTIRLAALHLTGLWLMYPGTVKYYIKGLRVLTLYGSVAFDEDFEAELSDNKEARTEVSLLAKSPDPELTQVFINTELYARVSVAVLFHKLAGLANTAEPVGQHQDRLEALESGKLFLLELLDFAVHDKDLAKELYKKYSAIHRRKIRAWQMICILSPFVDKDTVCQVTDSLHLCLYRNNLPAVRQYLESFAINIYLKFPSLVEDQLTPTLKNYQMKPQALSSYVFIAANVILHAQKSAQQKHLEELLPQIIPLLTSHHHSLRGFTQLLVHQVLFRLFPPVDPRSSLSMPLENRSFETLKAYLDMNPDCARLRSSMEGYLSAYDPTTAATPSGAFVNRVEENEFECVPTCLMDNVLSFLNDVRDGLRASMAKDADAIKTEGLKMEENNTSCVEGRLLEPSSSRDLPLDFQKKMTLCKLEQQNASSSSSLLGNEETYKRLLEMEKEDELVSEVLRCRSMEVERLKAGRQSILLVASLIDRIPNLAGLARTCEVFKASGLAVADASIIHDKQFQLISVTAEKWVPIIEVPVSSLKLFLEKKKRQGYTIMGLEQTANAVSMDKYQFPKKTVLVLGREKEGIPVDIIHALDVCLEIPQLGVVRSLNVHVSGALALWEYTRQHLSSS